MANFWEQDSIVESTPKDTGGDFWAKDAIVSAEPQGKTSNPFKGLAARGASILGEGIEGIARVAEKAGDKLETAIPLSDLTPEQIKNEQQLQPLFNWADSLRNWGKEIGYEPSVKLGELGSNPLKTVPFIAERVISSSPDMAAAVVAMPAYVAARTNEILNDRLKNDGKTLEDATISDVAAAAGSATLEATLERFATKGLLKGKGVTGKNVATRVAKEAGIQSGTEALEEGIGYLGGTAGTKKGVDTTELATSMLEGAIVGAGLGGGVQGGKEYVGKKTDAVVPPPADKTTGDYIVDENGQVISKSALPKQEATTPAAPLTGQGELFTTEEAPYQVTPSERTAQTIGGETVVEPIADAEVKAKQEASDAAQAKIAELNQRLSQAASREEVAQIRDEISKLELDVQQGPGATLDTFKQEYDTLEAKKGELKVVYDQLIAQRDATPSLDGKNAITQQINALESQGQQINARQQELLAEGKKTAKEVVTEEEVAAEPELNVENVITEDDFKTMKIGSGNKKLRAAILGKSLANPEEKQAVIDALTKYSQGKISSDMATRVGNFIDSISQEAPSGDIRTGSDSGTSQPSISVPSGTIETTEGLAAPIATGVGSPVGVAGGPAGGAGVSGETGNVALDEAIDQAEAPAPQKVAPKEDISGLEEADRKNLEVFGRRNKRVSPNWLTKKIDEFKDARKRGISRIDALFGKGQNIASFDQAFNNQIRNHLMRLKNQGDLTMEQVKQALLRIDTGQALHRTTLANQIMELGDYTYDPVTNTWTAVADDVNMGLFEDLVNSLATRLNVSEKVALEMMDSAYEAYRLDSFYSDLNKAKAEATRTQKKIDVLQGNKKRSKSEQKDLDTKKALLEKLNEQIERLESKTQHKTRAQVQAGMNLYNSHPEIQEGTKVWNTMRERTIKMMVDTGLLTEEKAEDYLDEAAYVPFFRDLEEEKGTGADTIMARGLKESLTPLRAHMVGSMLEVTSPIGNMHKWMQYSMSLAISNKQQQVMIDQYMNALPEEVREGKGQQSNTFGIYRDGVQRFYHVADPVVAQAFMHMSPMVFPGISSFKGASNMLRHSVTRMPFFPIAQVFMDAYAVMFTSGLKSPFKTLLEIAKEVGRTYKGTSATREMLIRKGILETLDYNALQEADAVGSRLGFEKQGVMQRIFKNLDRFASLADNVVRQGVYNQARKEGQSDKEATVRATEIVNFRRMSGMPGVQAASQIIPFFNAWNQVTAVTVKTLTGRGIVPQERSEGLRILRNTSAKVAMVSFLYAMMMGDDEDYDKKNKDVRDRLWMIPGTGFGIPIRMDLFAIPKIVGEYTYNLLMDKGFSDSKHMKNALKRAVLGSITPPSEGVPQFIRPTLEVAMNYDMFQDRNIINPTMRKLDPEQRFTKSTSEWAKVMGKLTGISPVNLDHLAKGYFGSVATLTSLFTDTAIAEMRGVPRAEKSWRDTLSRLPNIGTAIGKDENTAVMSDFYEVARDVNQVVDSYRDRAKYNNKEAREYINEPERRTLSNLYGGVKDISGALEKLKREETRVLNLPDRTEENPYGMTGEEKGKRIEELNQIRERLVSPTYRMRKSAGF